MNPPDEKFFALLADNFSRTVPHVAELGITIDRIDETGAYASLPYREDWLADAERGFIHTGVITTLVDSVAGAALLARLAMFEGIATLDLRMDYLRPALRDKALHCKAECYRLTSQIAFVRAEVWQDNPAEPVANAQAAFMRSNRSKRRERASA